MSSRERLRAAFKEPSRHPSFPSFLSSPSFFHPFAPSPLHNLSSPEVHRYFTYTRLSSPLRERLSRNARSFPGEQPLWHRREPALISHLPLFFISDIRIYHRDPAGTPLESRGEEGEGMETNRGPRRVEEGKGQGEVGYR